MRVPKLSMEIFAAIIAAAERKSLKLAAHDLGLTPSAVHKRIDKATEVLGATLFMGTDKGLMLTDMGKSFYRDALHVIEYGLLAENKLAARLELEKGQLLIGRSAYLPPLLLRKILKLGVGPSSSNPVRHVPGLTRMLAERVAEGTLHLGFGELPVDQPKLLSRILWEESVLVCVHVNHPLSLKAVIRPEDLRRESMIAVGRDLWPQSYEEIDEFFRGFGIELNVVADAFGPHEAVVMVEQKVGVCLLAASDISKPTVVGKPLSPRTLIRRWGIFGREDNEHPAIRAFVDNAVHQISQRQG